MAKKDAQGNMHSEQDGKFVSNDDLSAAELKEQLQQELPSQDLQVANDGDKQSTYGTQAELNELLGEEFTGYKGQEAVDKLLKEKRGHVKGAFHRGDIGDIDLIWGNESAGLLHAINQRSQEKNGDAHVKDMLENLTEAITNGEYSGKSKHGNFEFRYRKNGATYHVLVAPEYHGNKLVFIVTSFRRGKNQK